MQSIIDYLLKNWLENLGILATLVCVWLNIKENIWGWPIAILAAMIYGYIFYDAKLYSDMELQGVFIAISAYGWWKWFNGAENESLPITTTPNKYYGILVIIGISFALISGYLHAKYSDASLPYFDSSLTAISLVAQWLLARKYIENWLLWMVANVGYITLYFSKNLSGTAVLYVLLLIMAVKGFLDWRKTQLLTAKQ